MASPLPTYQRNYIIELSALGNNRNTVCRKFKDRYGREISPGTVTRLRAQPKVRVAINDAQKYLTGTQHKIVSGSLLKQRLYHQIDKQITRVEEDETEIDLLRGKMRAGLMSRTEFEHEVKRYETLTINELVKLTDMTHNHSRQENDDLPMTPEDQAAFGMLMQGLKNGNPLQLIQVLNPKVYPNGESPEHQADIPSTPASAG